MCKEAVEEKEGEDYPTLIGKKWTPFELSLVCIPADEGCYVRNQKIKERLETLGVEIQQGDDRDVLLKNCNTTLENIIRIKCFFN